MKTYYFALLFLLAGFAHSTEPGFVPLFEGEQVLHWKQCGPGGLTIDSQGVGTTWWPAGKRYYGVAWYSAQPFGDFVLRGEFQPVSTTYNSGIRLRFSEPGSDPAVVSQSGYEICITSEVNGEPNTRTGAIAHEQAPARAAEIRPLPEWNIIEVSVEKQNFEVTINGTKVTRFKGNKALSGYIGIETHMKGPVRWRNLRIQPLSAGSPSVAVATTTPTTMPAATSVPAPVLPPIQTDPNQPRIEVIRDQGPNAVEWALAPLEEPIPPNIRQNLTYLREDLLDEAKAGSKAPAEAYTLGSVYCDKILQALELREQARVEAGYRAAQAVADIKVSNSQLDARRNYQMSWPQYYREESQRAALREQETNRADLKKEKVKVDWAERARRMRPLLDQSYREVREAMR